MRNVILLLALAAALLAGCQRQSPDECRIHGTVVGQEYEGKRIFLVPLVGPKTAETVDSMEISNGRFEFTADSMQMYKLLMDYHYRMNLQQLLVVGEPGDVSVVIDSVSRAWGTPQNDSLQQWKEYTENFQHRRALLSREMSFADPHAADSLKQLTDSLVAGHRLFTRRMAGNTAGTVLGNFLKDFYPN